MSKTAQHLIPLHPILRQHAFDQMMFAFVRGVLAAGTGVTVWEALKMFQEIFDIEDFNIKSTRAVYYRLSHAYMKQNSIFNETCTKLQAHGRPSRILQRDNGIVNGKK